MMPARLTPEAERLAHSRAELLERMRWLAPNSMRGRQVAAEIRRLAREELRLEVRAEQAESQKSGNPDRPQAGEAEERRPRFWWIGDER